MTNESLAGIALALLLLLALAAPAAAKYPDDLPPAEKAIAGTVDPWGLPFSDSLRRFQERFGQHPPARFVAGLTHDLVKVWPNKYWFRGETVAARPGEGAAALKCREIIGAAGETVSFQVAALPRQGAPETRFRVDVTVTGAGARQAVVYQQVFVRTAEPGYPRFVSERWPDPLVPGVEQSAGGLDLALWWVDVPLGANLPAGELGVRVTVTDGQESARLEVPVRVVGGLNLQPKSYPLVAWFRPRYGTKTLNRDQMLQMGALALEHHLQPMDLLTGYFKPEDPAEFDQMHAYLAARGQTVFQIDRPGKKYDYQLLYDHVKKAGWLDQALVYSNVDEPLREVFYRDNVPFRQEMRRKYPGLKVFLASAYHPGMEQGCDLWMTDISTEGYEPERMRHLKAPTLWHYYCHLPIHIQFRAPLTLAPEMEVDNEALAHRLALWMSEYYGAKGVFIWAGFSAAGLKDDFWQTLMLEDKPGGYPYGGIHNGNNFLVYPPREEGGAVLPSVRLKVLRDGMEDLALLREARRLLAEGKIKGPRAQRLQELLNPVPGVFVHPQYWDRLPETLLGRREAILRTLAAAQAGS